ncbi:MAG: choice-of-anchor J domain-containing protein [Bacteroidetes bacterium]|nr:choice-of-anchor J domain-containing protein [Bacteroidota bacterium]MCL2303609.1 choice-of-anchor J domain-containing protein [Lentimicrobiaceae bacterium]
MRRTSNILKLIAFLTIFLHGFGYVQAQEASTKTVSSFPWTEDFESTTFPPAGWTILDISGTRTWASSTDYAHSGLRSAEHGWLAGGVQATALVTPAITLPSTGTPELDFWSRIQLVGYNNSSKILISTTVNNNINAFTEVRVLGNDEVGLATWKNFSIPLDAYVGQTIYIAFLYTADNGPRWFIDDVTISHLDSYVDMQALSITPITGSYAILSENEQVTVRLRNNGGQSASGFGIKLVHNGNLMATETFAGSIPSMGESTYIFNTTLNLSVAGMHKIQAIVNMSGDQVPANDTATAMVNNLGCQIVTAFPYEEGFENNGNNLPPCWTQEYVAKNFNWRVFNATGAQAIPGLQPVQPFAGDYKVVFYTNGKDGAITKLITPPLNLSIMNNPVLKFHHVQQHYSGDQDSLKVYYRTSANGAWILLEKYTDMIVDWTERMIPLPEPSSQYYIAFEGYAEWGHSVQLDNIFIGDLFEVDIAVKAITPSGVHLGLSAQQEVTTTIKNNGRNPVTGFDLTLYFNGNFIATENFAGTIPGLGEYTYTFNAKVDLSVSGTYTLTVVADLEGDEVPENNELTVVVKNLVCNALTFPYEEGFEEEVFPPHCWTKVGDWRRLTYGAHSGIGRAWHDWYSGTIGWLISPKFSIPAGGNYALEFWSYIYYRNYFSYSGIWVSTTNTNPSSFTELYALSYADIPEEEWRRIAVSLSAYVGQDIYIAFKYTRGGSNSGHGWGIDDVNVFNLDTHIDAEIVAITTPPDLGMNLTTQEAVTVQVRNNGGATISGFQLKLEHNGTVIATETYTGTIPSMATANYTFSAKLNLSAAGFSTAKVTVILANDMDPDNDSKIKTVENRVCPAITDFPWYGTFQGNTAGEIADCWVNIDADGDTRKWRSLEANEKYYAISESYDAYWEFELMPDNWLLTPPLTLEHPYLLSFKVGSANSDEWGAEKYSVLISTTDINPASFTAIHTETLNPADYTELLGGTLSGYGVKTVVLPLDAYTGKTVHIAFRHWDCTAQDLLLLTDIGVAVCVSIPEATTCNANPLVAWVKDDILYIKGLNIGDTWSVYSTIGKLLHQSVANNEVMSVRLNTHGVYFIRSGNRVVKVVY